jgi:hypothetical protein
VPRRSRSDRRQAASERAPHGPTNDADRFLTEQEKINGLAPRNRFLGAPGRHHLADDGRQYSRGMLPADQVEALEGLVDEVERVSGICESPLDSGFEERLGEDRRGETGRDCREQRTLRRLAMADP